MNVFGANALEICLCALRRADDRELGDQVVLPGLIQGRKLCRARMGEVMEVEWVGNEALHLLIFPAC
jgi:hypothetical protein